MAAFADGDYAGCARLLHPALHEAVRLGGSHAQREVIEDLLLVALMKGCEPGKARALLDERLHRRPSPRDTRWWAALVSRTPPVGDRVCAGAHLGEARQFKAADPRPGGNCALRG